MSASHHVFLHLDGNRVTGLSTSPLPDPELVDAMAAALRRYDAATTEAGAMRCLLNQRFAPGDIAALLGRARSQASSFDTWLERVEMLSSGDVFPALSVDAVNAFAEGVTAADYALQLQAARGAA